MKLRDRFKLRRNHQLRIGFGIGYNRHWSHWLQIDFCMWQLSIMLDRY